MEAFCVPLAALVGLALGSFANVLIYRVPRGLSIVSPPSSCPSCGHQISATQNIPVISWLWLRGRCRWCQAKISARYPIVEFATAVGFVVVVLTVGVTFHALVLCGLVYFGLVLGLIDIELRRLPDPLVAAFGIYVALVVVASGMVSGWADPLRSVIGAAALGTLYLVAFIIYPKGLGFGDVKLAPVLGALLGFFGWPALVVGGFAAFLWGAVAGVTSMWRAGKARGVAIPFGPWMIIGAATGILVGEPIAEWYVRLAGF